MRTTIRVAAVLACLALLAAGTSSAATPSLSGSVGPGFTISLKKGGKKVGSLPAGKYRVSVNDRSSSHNFRLRGPGVNVATSVEATGARTFTVTLKKGVYTFLCDPHASTMRGSFRVG